jgi:hypothetical protein
LPRRFVWSGTARQQSFESSLGVSIGNPSQLGFFECIRIHFSRGDNLLVESIELIVGILVCGAGEAILRINRIASTCVQRDN